jgi:hypothetical protein
MVVLFDLYPDIKDLFIAKFKAYVDESMIASVSYTAALSFKRDSTFRRFWNLISIRLSRRITLGSNSNTPYFAKDGL